MRSLNSVVTLACLHAEALQSAEHRSKDAISEWIEANVPEAGKVTGRTGMGSSGWASSSRYDTDSGMAFFVKQASGPARDFMSMLFSWSDGGPAARKSREALDSEPGNLQSGIWVTCKRMRQKAR